MNNHRLSSKSRNKKVDRAILLTEIDNLLSKPSNLEYQDDGRIYIISEQRFLVQGGGSRRKVELLYPEGTLIQTISAKLQKGERVNYNNQSCIIRKI
jgi:hypothetical protein